MRLLRVRGAGLASLADPFEIDLTTPAIQNAGLFMISGHTGAGKSTILDAIALALFDEFPRLEGSDADQNIGVATGKLEKANAPSAILSRGLAQGYAEVEFRGADGFTYRARWEIHRARKKAAGDLQNSVRSLVRLDDGGEHAIGGTKKEVAARILEVLGLTYDQFTRTVLLAQNRFDAFLTAADKDRAELLEKITGDDLYARISKYVYRTTSQKHQAIEGLTQQAGTLQFLSAEDLARMSAEQETLQAQVAATKLEEQALIQEKSWWESEQRLLAECADSTTAHQETLKAHGALEALRNELAQTRKALPLLPMITELDDARDHALAAQNGRDAAQASLSASQTLKSERNTATKSAEAACSAAEQAVVGFKQAWSEATELDRAIQATRTTADRLDEEHKTALHQHRQLALEHTALAQELLQLQQTKTEAQLVLEQHASSLPLLARRDECNRAFAKRRQCERTVLDLQKCLQETRDGFDQISARANSFSEGRAKTEADLAKIDELVGPLRARHVPGRIHNLNARCLDLVKHQSKLESLENTGTRLRSATSDLEQTKTELTCCDRTRREAQQSSEKCELEHPLLAARLDEIKTSINAVSLALHEDASRLRAQLIPGMACPVCGSIEHPNFDNDIQATVAPLRERQQLIEVQLADLRTKRSEAKAALSTNETTRATLENKLSGCITQLNTAQDRWRSECEGLPEKLRLVCSLLTPDDVAALDQIAALRKDLANELSALSVEIESERKHEATLAATEQQLIAATQAWDKQRADAEALQLELSTATSSVRVEETKLAAAHHNLQQTTSELSLLLAPLAFDTSIQTTDLSAIENTFGALMDKLASSTAADRAAQEQINTLSPRLAVAQAKLEHAAQASSAAQSARDSASEDLKRLLTDRAALLGGEATEIHRERHTELHAKRVMEHRALQQKLAEAEVALASARATLEHREAALATANDRRERASNTLTEALALYAFSEVEVRDFAARDSAWIEQADLTIRDADVAVAYANTRFERAKQALQDHQLTPRPNRALQAIVDELAALRQRCEVAAGTIGEISALIERDRQERVRHEGLLTKIEEARRAAAPWDAVNTAIGSAEGDKFRRFAQGHTLGVLLDLANEQLRLLSPRYRLARAPGSDLGIQVIDQDMADEVRGIRSLSGGERFLVSLAMALALSTLGAGKALIETLFIDEGFGSLDPESLDMALEGLEFLRSQGRLIGVISHVEAMRDRIPVQLVVHKKGAGRSTVSLYNHG